jgi:integrase
VRCWQRLGQRFCVEWNGAAVHDVDKAFRRNAGDAGMPDVTPHTLRHTAATWLMQGGADLWEAAGFLGMSVEQLERTYGHHHPDHLKGARDTLDRRPGRVKEQKASATDRPPITRNRTLLVLRGRVQKC